METQLPVAKSRCVIALKELRVAHVLCGTHRKVQLLAIDQVHRFHIVGRRTDTMPVKRHYSKGVGAAEVLQLR